HYTVNMRATMLLSTLFINHYSLETSGSIVNLTSGQSLGPMPNELAYIATKGAIEAFTTSVAPVAMKKGITVNAVDPGPTNTGWMTEEIKGCLVTRFPVGRIGEPVDVARLITFLVSEEAKWVTGQVIHSNGGFY
ncbi:SDR family oxidoreductase, partial [Bacillus pseudomycoides]|nr:SDR family oxidoreductase [Bacillus pseudomycoides]